MFTVTLKDLRIISSEPRALTVQATGWNRPIRCEVTPYADGVVIQIPWVHRERLGSPDYTALKQMLRRLYSGLIGTRTETDPKFRRAAEAREEKVLPSTGRSVIPLQAKRSA